MDRGNRGSCRRIEGGAKNEVHVGPLENERPAACCRHWDIALARNYKQGWFCDVEMSLFRFFLKSRSVPISFLRKYLFEARYHRTVSRKAKSCSRNRSMLAAESSRKLRDQKMQYSLTRSLLRNLPLLFAEKIKKRSYDHCADSKVYAALTAHVKLRFSRRIACGAWGVARLVHRANDCLSAFSIFGRQRYAANHTSGF